MYRTPLRLSFFFYVVFLFGNCAIAQNTNPKNKLTLSTHHLIATMTDNETIPVLVQGNISQIESVIRQHGETIKFSTGNVISANLSRNTLLELNTMNWVVKIDCPVGKILPMNDMMVVNNNVDSAYYGYAPLIQGYDGTGVVIGDIDLPYDVYHLDFTNTAGENRIKSVWDQNIAGGPHPDPFGYGKECDSATIAEGNCILIDNNEYNYSHGTGVVGVAASSGLAANRYRGVAPNADLVLVSFDFSSDFDASIADAVSYIFLKADAMGKPCVVNTSLGIYSGSHDGKDLLAETISSLITEKHGRSLIASAGNAGNQLIHLNYAVTPAEQFTWFNKLSYADLVYFQLYADSSEFNQVYFSLSADNPAGYIPMGSSADFNMLIDFDLNDGDIDSVAIDIPGAGSGWIFVQLSDGVYLIEGSIIPENATTYWRFTTYGSGNFDIWSGETTTGFSNFVTTGLPDAVSFPEIINYRMPDTHQTIVSSWQCSDNVITVGSYVNRDTMTNYYGDIPPLVDTLGELFYSSSRGPTRDNRIKPDICASGARILSTESSVLADWLISLASANYMSLDGMHYLYNGTSFASPIVAGAAALYFQEFPNAWSDDVIHAIISTANADSLTGYDLPDNDWGYGKLNTFRALLVSYVNIADINSDKIISFYPNPTDGLIHLLNNNQSGTLEMFNLLGERVFSTKVDASTIDIDISALSNGMYIISLKTETNAFTGKAVVKR